MKPHRIAPGVTCLRLTSRRCSPAAALLLAFLVTACASVNPAAMVPATTTQEMRVIPSGLRVGNVSAALEPSSSRYTLTADQLKQAIVASLRKAGAAGTPTSAASFSESLELRATIVGQRNTKDRTLGGVEIRRQLIVSYELFDVSKGQQVWRETYQSEFGSTTFGGNDAFNEAIEGSARENIKLMLEGLAAYFRRF